MIKRVFWLGMGVAIGVIVVRKVTRAAEAYSPSGLAGSARNSAAGLVDSVRNFVSDVRVGMAEREAQIQEAITEGVSINDLDADEYGDYLDDQDDTYGQDGYRRR